MPQPSTLADLTLRFAAAVRTLREFPEAARQLAALLPQAGPDDLPALATILKTLNVAPDAAGPEAGREFEGQLQVIGQQAAHEAGKAGVRAKYRADVLSAVGKPGAVASLDFGPAGARVVQLADRPPGKNTVAWGAFGDLPPTHPLRSHLTAGDCPKVGDTPVVYLGFAAADLAGVLRPAASYPLADVVRWTRDAARDERDKEERDRWEREQAAQAEAARRKPVPTQVELMTRIEALESLLKTRDRQDDGKGNAPAA